MKNGQLMRTVSRCIGFEKFCGYRKRGRKAELKGETLQIAGEMLGYGEPAAKISKDSGLSAEEVERIRTELKSDMM